MQLPSIDRSNSALAAGADLVSAGANRVIPVAPVNPAASDASTPTPSPGVINHVSPALQSQQQNGVLSQLQPATQQPNEGEPVYTSVPDPSKASALTPVAPHDRTIHKPASEKTQDPPPKPISQVLLDDLKTVWTASASAVQVQQVKNQLNPPTATTPALTPGTLAKQSLTYQPSKIKPNSTI